MPEPKKILVVTLSNLGDVVLTLPVFQALHDTFPAARLDAAVGAGSAAVFEGDSRIGHVWRIEKAKGLWGRLALIWAIRRERYDLIIDLRHSLIGILGGAKGRNRYFVIGPKQPHRADRHFSALRGIAKDGLATGRGWLRARPQASPSDRYAGQRLVVAAVGSKSDLKKWPAANYARLLDRLAFDQGCSIVLAGDRADAPDAAKVRSLMVCGTQVEDLTGRTSFDELLTLLASASLVVTNDSAPLHIADALDVPVLALFGPTDPRKYGPRGASSTSARRELACSPCEKAQCRYAHECMEELGVDEVHATALRILSGRRRQGQPRFLIIRLDRIGDVVLSLSAVQALRRQFPDAHISVMLRPETRELVEGHPAVDEVIVYDYKAEGRHRFPGGYLRFLSELRARRFDSAFVLHPGIRSSLLPFLAGIPRRLGYRDRWSFLLTRAVTDRRHLGEKHEADHALDVIRAYGVEAALEPPDLPVSRIETARMVQWTGEGPLIALHPGASCASKRWPVAKFEALALRLSAEYPHRILILGGGAEKPLGERLAKALGDRGVDLTGKLGLRALAAALKRCDLLISNDSGPVHVSAAVGTPVISLFGRSQAGLSARRWGPLGKNDLVIQKDVGCLQCLAHRCPIGFECLEAIEVQEVLEASRRYLQVVRKKEGVGIEA